MSTSPRYRRLADNWQFGKTYADGERLNLTVGLSMTVTGAVTATVRTMDGGLLRKVIGVVNEDWYYNRMGRSTKRYAVSVGTRLLDWERSPRAAAYRLATHALDLVLGYI